MLYRIVYYTPCKYESGWEATRTELVGTLRAAKLAADSWLDIAYESSYSARTKRHPFVDVYAINPEARRLGKAFGWKSTTPRKPVACHETPIRIVPSVGDLGYTP